MSILTNSIESLHDDVGEIEISFDRDHFEIDSLPITFQNYGLKNGIYAYCQIKDSGQGITPENLQRIFEPFFTTKFVGRGLGLALSVGVIRSHNGAVAVESTPGIGTIVKILLPEIEPFQKEIVLFAGSEKNTSKLSGDILLADDDDSILDIGRAMLEMLGFTVHTAEDGQKAVEMVCRRDIHYHAVVLDVTMPVMDGLEAMKEIRKCHADLPILLSSGYSEDDFLFENDMDSKPDGFLQKPFQLSDLRKSLEELLA